jgi:23S rRNA (guanosine2251-2'-O)-methyltransferase
VGGWNALEAALAADVLRAVWLEPDKLERARAAGAPADRCHALGRDELRRRFGDEGAQGIVCECDIPPEAAVDDLVAAVLSGRGPLVVLEEVQDPQNVGSIMRAALALGAVGLVTTRHRSAPFGAAMVRASAGAALRLPQARVGGVPNWLMTLPEDVVVVAASARDGRLPAQVPLAHALLVFGTERRGLKPLTLRRASLRVTIPAAGLDSLNVAQAAAILLYESARQRNGV